MYVVLLWSVVQFEAIRWRTVINTIHINTISICSLGLPVSREQGFHLQRCDVQPLAQIRLFRAATNKQTLDQTHPMPHIPIEKDKNQATDAQSHWPKRSIVINEAVKLMMFEAHLNKSHFHTKQLSADKRNEFK